MGIITNELKMIIYLKHSKSSIRHYWISFIILLGLLFPIKLAHSGNQEIQFSRFERIMNSYDEPVYIIQKVQPLLRRMESNCKQRKILEDTEIDYDYHSDLFYWLYAELITGNPQHYRKKKKEFLSEQNDPQSKVKLNGTMIPLSEALVDLRNKDFRLGEVTIELHRFTPDLQLDPEKLILRNDALFTYFPSIEIYLSGVESQLVRLPNITTGEQFNIYLPFGEYRLESSNEGTIPMSFTVGKDRKETKLIIEPGYWFEVKTNGVKKGQIVQIIYEGSISEFRSSSKDRQYRFGTYKINVQDIKNCDYYKGYFEVICSSKDLQLENRVLHSVAIPSRGKLELSLVKLPRNIRWYQIWRWWQFVPYVKNLKAPHHRLDFNPAIKFVDYPKSANVPDIIEDKENSHGR